MAFIINCFAGRRANTVIGQSLLFAADYARAALATLLLLLLLRNLMSDGNSHRTILDLVYAEPSAANYIAVWYVVDSISTVTIIILDALTGWCAAGVQDDLRDY